MWWCVVLVGLFSGAQAFAPASIRWAGLPGRNFFLVPQAVPNQDSAFPQALTISDQHGPGFAANADKTIRVETSNLCVEASGKGIGDTARINLCAGDHSLQRWNLLSQGHGQDMIQLRGTQNCLAAVEKRGGLHVELRECDNSVAEAWMFEEPLPKPMQSATQYASGVKRHAAFFSILMFVLGALSFSSWLRRRQMKSHVQAAATRWSDTPMRDDEGGVALTLPSAGCHDNAPSALDADVAYALRMIPAVMAMSQIPVEDDVGTMQSPRVNSSVMMARAYSTPEVTRDEWVRSHTQTYQERIIYLGEEINDSVINRCISQMLNMDAEKNAPIYLYINSPGGSVPSGLALYDTMQHVKSDVITINCGIAASTASLLLGAGVYGKRIALANSRVMIHSPAGGDPSETPGGVQALDARVEADQVLHIKDTVISIYSDQTGHPREKIAHDISYGDYHMSAQQALEYGLVDKVVPEPELPEL